MSAIWASSMLRSLGQLASLISAWLSSRSPPALGVLWGLWWGEVWLEYAAPALHSQEY